MILYSEFPILLGIFCGILSINGISLIFTSSIVSFLMIGLGVCICGNQLYTIAKNLKTNMNKLEIDESKKENFSFDMLVEIILCHIIIYWLTLLIFVGFVYVLNVFPIWLSILFTIGIGYAVSCIPI